MEWLFLCFSIASISLTNQNYQLNLDDTINACMNSNLVLEHSDNYDIDPFIIASIIWHESRWNNEVVSSAGACGLTQVMPGFEKIKCKELFNPDTAIEFAAKILRIYKDEHSDKNIESVSDDFYALSCYAVGPKCLESSYAKRHTRGVLKLANIYRNNFNLLTFGISG